jgi:NitT/TauT family transport system substrate-binding protein
LKWAVVMAMTLAFGLVLSACGTGGGAAADGSDDRTVDVGYVPLPLFAPLYVADAKGYFADEGLKVHLEKVQSGQAAVPLAASGKLDAVLVGFSAGMFGAIHTGLKVKVVGSMGVTGSDTENPSSALVVSKKLVHDGKVTSMADLKGRRIGALGGVGSASAYYVGMALKKAGLTINDVRFVPLDGPDIPTGIKTGGIDAAFVSTPFWKRAVDDGVAVKSWSPPKGSSATGVLYSGQFSTSPSAHAFFDALARAARDLQGGARYSRENLEIIGKATGQTPGQVRANPLHTWLPDLAPLPGQLAAMEKTWMQAGVLNYATPIPPRRYVDTRFAKHVGTKP